MSKRGLKKNILTQAEPFRLVRMPILPGKLFNIYVSL